MVEIARRSCSHSFVKFSSARNGIIRQVLTNHNMFTAILLINMLREIMNYKSLLMKASNQGKLFSYHIPILDRGKNNSVRE